MAIISSYPYDVTIQDNDAWIGTDSINRQTKQYTANSIAKYLNINGKLSVGGQMVYGFSSVPLGGTGTFSLPNGGGSSAYSAIDSIKISILEKSGQNVVPFVSYLVGSEILINAQDEAGSFGHYGVTSYAVDPDDSGFYVMGLSYIGGNGNVTSDKLYDIVNFTKSTTAEVEAVSGGSGIQITGTTKQPIVNVDYSSSGDNLIQAATESAAPVGTGAFSPYILMNESYPGVSAALTKKIRIGNIPLSKFGTATSELNVGDQKISNLASPTSGNDAANKTYVDSALTGYVQSVTAGNGVLVTGSSAAPTVAVDYSTGSDNLIQSASTTNTINGGTYGDYILKSASDPGTPNGAVERIRVSDIPVSTLGEATGTLSMGNRRIKNLGAPIDGTDTANKAYVDSAVVGGLFYQGGYNASTNTPDLESSPNSILKGWTYTVTSDGNFFGELLRVGDVLIAESNDPSSIADWTTVQNNIDLASATQVGIGNVLAGEAVDVAYNAGSAIVSVEDSTANNKGAVIVSPGEAMNVTYSNGTATVSVEDSTASNKGAVIIAGGTNVSVAYSNGTATINNTATSPASSASGTISAGQTSGTVTHALGTNVIVQTYKSTGETVFCDIDRTTTTVTATISSSISSDINIIVHKIT